MMANIHINQVVWEFSQFHTLPLRMSFLGGNSNPFSTATKALSDGLLYLLGVILLPDLLFLTSLDEMGPSGHAREPNWTEATYFDKHFISLFHLQLA